MSGTQSDQRRSHGGCLHLQIIIVYKKVAAYYSPMQPGWRFFPAEDSAIAQHSRLDAPYRPEQSSFPNVYFPTCYTRGQVICKPFRQWNLLQIAKEVAERSLPPGEQLPIRRRKFGLSMHELHGSPLGMSPVDEGSICLK